MDMDKNHPFVKQQIKQAHRKSILCASIFTAIFIILTFSHQFYFLWVFGFFFSTGVAFVWFSRKVHKYLEPYEPHRSDPVIDGINMNNGYPPGSHFISPTPLWRRE